MKQQCPMVNIYLSWVVFVGGLAFFAWKGYYLFALLWLIVTPLAQWAYVRAFPSISRYMGYGRVDDEPVRDPARAPTEVTLYTALGCPFCPVVKRRLLELQREMGFHLREVDVTLKPDLLIARGIRAVPVVEMGERRIVGHATSRRLAALIGGSPSEAVTNQRSA